MHEKYFLNYIKQTNRFTQEEIKEVAILQDYLKEDFYITKPLNFMNTLSLKSILTKVINVAHGDSRFIKDAERFVKESLIKPKATTDVDRKEQEFSVLEEMILLDNERFDLVITLKEKNFHLPLMKQESHIVNFIESFKTLSLLWSLLTYDYQNHKEMGGNKSLSKIFGEKIIQMYEGYSQKLKWQLNDETDVNLIYSPEKKLAYIKYLATSLNVESSIGGISTQINYISNLSNIKDVSLLIKEFYKEIALFFNKVAKEFFYETLNTYEELKILKDIEFLKINENSFQVRLDYPLMREKMHIEQNTENRVKNILEDLYFSKETLFANIRNEKKEFNLSHTALVSLDHQILTFTLIDKSLNNEVFYLNMEKLLRDILSTKNEVNWGKNTTGKIESFMRYMKLDDLLKKDNAEKSMLSVKHKKI